jgi:exosortase/archaeosortase family protein
MKIDNLSYDIKAPEVKKLILTFFVKLVVLFTVWYLFYNFILGPGRMIDRPLTNILTAASARCLSFLHPASNHFSWVQNHDNRSSSILLNNHSVLGVADNCNGLQLIFTYLSLIFLLPSPVKRKIIFTIGGILAISAANITRICILYFIYTYKRVAFDFSHHYLFTILMDILIFYGWLLFIKNRKTA